MWWAQQANCLEDLKQKLYMCLMQLVSMAKIDVRQRPLSGELQGKITGMADEGRHKKKEAEMREMYGKY